MPILLQYVAQARVSFEDYTTRLPFAVWGLDMVGPLRTGRSGFTHVLVAVDKFTKWIEDKPHQEPRCRYCYQLHQRIDIQIWSPAQHHH